MTTTTRAAGRAALLVAGVCLLLSLGACGDGSERPRAHPVPTSGGGPISAQDVVDHELRIVQVASPAGVTDVSGIADASVTFGSDGYFVVDDAVNTTSGPYTRAAGGVRLGRDLGATAVGYTRSDTTRTALLDAIGHVAVPHHVVCLRRDGNRIVVTSGRYALICTG